MFAGFLPAGGLAQNIFTWQQIKDKFEATNPTLQAARANIAESKAGEITAYLRPNPDFTATIDQINPFASQLSPSGSGQNVYRPLANALPFASFSYLHEREHKRELRRDRPRNRRRSRNRRIWTRSAACCSTCEMPSCKPCRPRRCCRTRGRTWTYWDRELEVNRTRFKAGDLAQVDLNRLELQRVQFESDFETATVNLRTAKIQLLMLLNDRTPIEQFDVTGPYDFTDELRPLEEFRNDGAGGAAGPEGCRAERGTGEDQPSARRRQRLDRSDVQRVVDSQSFVRNPSDSIHVGASVSIPLRIFDRNQGEKARTQIDIGRNERLRDGDAGAGIQRCRFRLLDAGPER